MTVIDGPIISADSHITEPPDTYIDRIDAAFRDRAPYMQHDDKAGDLFVIPGMSQAGADGPGGGGGQAGRGDHRARRRTSTTCTAAAGTPRPASPSRTATAWPARSSTRPSAWCSATTRTSTTSTPAWTPTTSGSPSTAGAHPDRLFGIGQTAMRTPEEGIADLERIKRPRPARRDDARRPRRRGLRLPDLRRLLRGGRRPRPAAVVPHPHRAARAPVRGPKINGFLSIVRGCQDVMGTFVFGGVFERHPDLKVVCVEADAGWVPHYMYRMDHAYERHRNWMPARRAVQDAERVLPREHLRDVPGRLGGVQGGATS